MKDTTKQKLLEAYQYCNDNDKSTEFMLEYMQDFANVDLDCVLNFLQNHNK
jgi:lipopolysaccharide biosynthesis regulator YciM